MSISLGSHAAHMDTALLHLEAAAGRVESSRTSTVLGQSAELDLLHSLETCRDLVLAVLHSNREREVLVATLGQDGGERLRRIRVVLEVRLSEVGERDLRKSSCRAACDSAEQVLLDLGLLRRVPSKQALRLPTAPARATPLSAQATRDDKIADTSLFSETCSTVALHDSGESSDEESAQHFGAVSVDTARMQQDSRVLQRQHRLCASVASGRASLRSIATDASSIAQLSLPPAPSASSSRVQKPSPQPEEEPTNEALFGKHLQAAKATGESAVRADQNGNKAVAIKRYAQCSRALSAALEFMPSAFGPEQRTKLTKHKQQVLRRRKYLRGLPADSEVTLPVHTHIEPVELKAPGSGEDMNGWQSLAACAALGAAGGFVVLGGTIAIAAGVVGSAAGAAAGVYCATRKDNIGQTACSFGSVAVSKAEEVIRCARSLSCGARALGGSSNAASATRSQDQRNSSRARPPRGKRRNTGGTPGSSDIGLARRVLEQPTAWPFEEAHVVPPPVPWPETR
mmetsp:Transcript_65033/g.121143  ORF Transcript_65033/g.121143 Transcript_65033/m.121143 type:complete len:514 (-) Transcript_65033:70-1611(-)